MPEIGFVHSVESFGALDGPGIRYVLFLQGCPLRCIYCHNPDTWLIKDGKQMSSDEVVSDILKYKNFFRSGGVTLSGGEPLFQPKFCFEILSKCKDKGIHTAIDTSGAVALEKVKDCIDIADLILLDIKSLDESEAKEITGLSNKGTMGMLNYCEETGKKIWIRHVLLPNYTLDFKKLEKLAEFLKKYSCIENVQLLPFHKMGEFKWESLKKEYTLKDLNEPKKEDVEKAKKIFADAGFSLK